MFTHKTWQFVVVAAIVMLIKVIGRDAPLGSSNEWEPQRGTQANFTLEAHELSSLSVRQGVHKRESDNGRSDWKAWSSIDQPTLDLEIIISATKGVPFLKMTAEQRLREMSQVIQMAHQISAPPLMTATRLGAVEMVPFRVAIQGNKQKSCLGFHGVEGGRSVSGWYCAAPTTEAVPAHLTCLLDRVVLPTDSGEMPRPKC